MTPLEQRLADALRMIAGIGEGSTTVNSLLHIAKIARAELAALDKPTDKWANAPEWAKWLAMDLYLWDTVPLFTHPPAAIDKMWPGEAIVVPKEIYDRLPDKRSVTVKDLAKAVEAALNVKPVTEGAVAWQWRTRFDYIGRDWSSWHDLIRKFAEAHFRGEKLCAGEYEVRSLFTHPASQKPQIADTGMVPAPSEPVAWLCDGPHGKSVHIDIRKLRAETGHTLTPLYTHPTAAIDKGALVGLVDRWWKKVPNFSFTTTMECAIADLRQIERNECAIELRAVIDKMP